MPGGKETPQDLLHREPRQRAPREDLRVHRLKVDDPTMDPPKKVGGHTMKKTATFTPEFHSAAIAALEQVAGKLEQAGSKQAARLLDQVANELDSAPEFTLTVEQKHSMCANIDRVSEGLQKAGATESAELLDKVQNDLDNLFADGEGQQRQAASFSQLVQQQLQTASKTLMDMLNTAQAANMTEIVADVKGLMSSLNSLAKEVKPSTTSVRQAANPGVLLGQGASTVLTSLVDSIQLLQQGGEQEQALARKFQSVLDSAKSLKTKAKSLRPASKQAATADEDCVGCDKPSQDEDEVVSDLEEDTEAGAPKEANADVVSVKLTSAIRLAGEPDSHGFRTPSFVKEATKAKWAEAVQKLVDSGKGYHQDGTPAYGRAIDQYKASL